MIHEVCDAIASETAILDALHPHYDLQSVNAEFAWAAKMAPGFDDPREIQWEAVIEQPRRFPSVTNHVLYSGTLDFYLMMVAQGTQRDPAFVTLFSAAQLRGYVPGRSDVDARWVALLIHRALMLGPSVVLATLRFLAWHFRATNSSATDEPTTVLGLAIGMGHLTSQLARQWRESAPKQARLGCFDSKVEFPIWRTAIDEVLTFGKGVDESLWYAREALNFTERDTRR